MRLPERVSLHLVPLMLLAACGGDARPRFGQPADPDRLETALVSIDRQAPEAVAVALAQGVLELCGEKACGCLRSVSPDAPPDTPTCPAANDSVPPLWPPMELAGRYLADQVAHADDAARSRLLVAMATLRVPVPRVDGAAWSLPEAGVSRALSPTRAIVGVKVEGPYTVAALPTARFDEHGARIEEAKDAGRQVEEAGGVAEAIAAVGKPAPDPTAAAPADPDLDDAQRARQQAIDQARAAGVLGQLGQGGQGLGGLGIRDDDLSAAFDDADAYGGLFGGDPGDAGGFGYGRQRVILYTFGATRDGDLATDPNPDVKPSITVAADAGAGIERVAALLDVHPGALAVRVGAQVRELPVAFGEGHDPRATPAFRLHVQADQSLRATVDDREVGQWLRKRDTGYDLAAIQAALPAHTGARRHAAIVMMTGTVGDLAQLVEAALAADATTIAISVRADLGGFGTSPPSTIGLRSAGGRGGVPQVSLGQPQSVGDLDKAIIRRYIKRNINKITYCYEKELLAKPSLEGTVSTQFFISPTGAVASASANGVDPAVASCIAAVIKAIEFPRPRGGGGVQVNYPFRFLPAP